MEAVESGRVAPGALILMPAFGGGLTLSSHLIRWGERTTPLGTTAIDLPPCERTALEIVNGIRAQKVAGHDEAECFLTLGFAEQSARG